MISRFIQLMSALRTEIDTRAGKPCKLVWTFDPCAPLEACWQLSSPDAPWAWWADKDGTSVMTQALHSFGRYEV